MSSIGPQVARPVALLGVLLLACGIAGCSNSIISPNSFPFTHRANLVAVTAPESLVAGRAVTLYAHCANFCPDSPPFAGVHLVRPDSAWVEVLATQQTDVVCLETVGSALP